MAPVRDKKSRGPRRTKTRVYNYSNYASRRQPSGPKKPIFNTSYLFCDEFSFISSDTSGFGDWECITGGLPNRDLVRERKISDGTNKSNYAKSFPHPQTSRNNTKFEILDDQVIEPLMPECPISIISAEPKESTLTSNLDTTLLICLMKAVPNNQKNSQ